ncbi:type III secretion system inner membrane ring lipoprotein SctJ [Erwinia psidii]|uniref:Lipoprotein n=1 Tax=Erwinia psidii TaxID=69224 RepID=A0A3N6SJI7_9GAMM|nr:type III secretion inner membrane ring lipoprotein SctJ [Erwinia psidii]MCX8958724.1 EscJ/YscJ/HrcJ family type III secretion inner membrane ring protein [Erwinia psidii]MCX8961146.1 EscJ/YscJ/HrcJ family type III secretion inner membrane ring protein [Erwinia psidii]MCX8966682.1 EscJ/YscJ/HrcJ family type III secretion inner membrane ring protein [Erwinia psidii]RQM38941.1 EscJ/YscJ/HrcJ family type III secretion inner membrane ring protein [Erwinia psidii]
MLKNRLRAILLLSSVIFLSACKDDALLNNLTQEQANQVLAILLQHNIAAQKNGTLKAGYSITINHADATAALSIINQYQLPRPADVQISQAFPEGSLVASPNAEQARVLSMQEQRLEQTLKVIAQVVNAKVHISYPPFDNGPGNKRPAGHVGVLISHKGDIDENTFIPQIKSLIKNSLNDIRYENIAIALFPASSIQYASPTKAPTTLSGVWVWLPAVIVLFAAITAGYILLKFSHRPHPATGSGTEEVKSE